MTPNLEALADLSVGVVSKEAAHGKATAALAAAQAARDAVASGLSQAQQRQREVGLRRAAGDERADDAQELGVLHADIAGLQDLLARRDADVAAAQEPVRMAAAAAVSAKHLLSRAEAQATEQALASRAEEAARVLAETLTQLRSVRDANGGGLLAWRPGQELMGLLTVAHHGRMF